MLAQVVTGREGERPLKPQSGLAVASRRGRWCEYERAGECVHGRRKKSPVCSFDFRTLLVYCHGPLWLATRAVTKGKVRRNLGPLPSYPAYSLSLFIHSSFLMNEAREGMRRI